MTAWRHYYQLIPGQKMGRGGIQCVRITLIILNLVVSLFSCAALGLGIYLQLHNTAQGRLLTAQYSTLSTDVILLTVGCIGIVVCIMGCCGSWTISRCLLVLYLVCVSLLFIGEIGGIMYFLIFRDTLTDNFRYEQKLSIRMRYLPHSLLSTIWDSIQNDFGCCGMDSPADWHYIAAWPELPIAPDSCCVPERRALPNCGKSFDPRDIYPRGCFEVIRDYVTRNMYIFVIAAVLLALIQLSGIFFSVALCCVGRRLHEEKVLVVTTRDEPEFVEVVRRREPEFEVIQTVDEAPPPRYIPPPLPVKPSYVEIKPAYVETNL